MCPIVQFKKERAGASQRKATKDRAYTWWLITTRCESKFFSSSIKSAKYSWTGVGLFSPAYSATTKIWPLLIWHNIGQPCVFDDLNKGTPSILKINFITLSVIALWLTYFLIPNSIPRYLYVPPHLTSVSTADGVLQIVSKCF